MTNSSPRLSILIPTRNRAHLLDGAVRTALAQDFDDYEIVISNNDSSDDTEQVIRSFDDPRIRYIKTEKTLAMPYHWDWAIKHVKGQYVTVLCDDDALSPHCCSRAWTAIEQTGSPMVAWHRLSYVYPTWQGREAGNTVRVRRYSGRFERMESRDNLLKWYDSCSYLKHSPMLFNSFCQRALIDRIFEEAGTFFLPPSPDVGAALSVLSHIDHYHHLDIPMALAGVSPDSIGATSSTSRGAATQTFASEFDHPMHQLVPFTGITITVAITEVLLRAQKLLPHTLGQYNVNWDQFWSGCLFDLYQYRRNNVDVTEDLKELNRLIDELDPAMRQRVRNAADARLKKVKRQEAMTKLKQAMFGWARSGAQVIHGDQAGFSNIFECAMKLDELTGYRDPA